MHAAISDDDLRPAQGYWRQKRADVHAWEAGIHVDGVPCDVTLTSWDSMTECARYGVTLEADGPASWQVWAKVPGRRLTQPATP